MHTVEHRFPIMKALSLIRVNPCPSTTKILFACALFAASGFAQNDADPVFRSDVKLVRLITTVKNAQGQPVGGLTKSDFTVVDSGVPQEIAAFESYTAQPLSITLLVDTSGSTAKDLKAEISAVGKFLKALTKVGNPMDALSFYSFNQDVTQQTGFTRTPERVERLADRLLAEAGTSLYDALTLAAEPLSKRDGRHVAIVITDGGDTTSARTYQDALRSLHAADAILFPIVIVPIHNGAGRNTGGENALTTLAQSTGGRPFFPDAVVKLEDTFAQILRDLRTQYLIGYYPRGLPAAASPFRRVKLTLKRTDLQASTRDGYYER
jgi:Ca-activated chloride channel homolog